MEGQQNQSPSDLLFIARTNPRRSCGIAGVVVGCHRRRCALWCIHVRYPLSGGNSVMSAGGACDLALLSSTGGGACSLCVWYNGGESVSGGHPGSGSSFKIHVQYLDSQTRRPRFTDRWQSMNRLPSLSVWPRTTTRPVLLYASTCPLPLRQCLQPRPICPFRMRPYGEVAGERQRVERHFEPTLLQRARLT